METAVTEKFKAGAGVMTVDPKTVDAWSARFTELMQSVKKRDTEHARKLLSTKGI